MSFVKKIGTFIISLALLCGGLILLSPNNESRALADSATVYEVGYYYKDLTINAKKIYNVLASMRDNGQFRTGTKTIDLVKEGVLPNDKPNQNVLMADFGAARDAFRFDNPHLFYVDFDKLSLRVLQNDNKYKITIGIGRENHYFAEGFNADNVDDAIVAFNNKVDTISQVAGSYVSIYDKMSYAYTELLKGVEYALEKDADEGNVEFVRSPYGTLVKGQSVCEGYARAYKTILDTMDIENVLVQGAFVNVVGEGVNQTRTPNEHMWNYVKLDDNRWYLVDATMEDGVNESGTSREFFVKNGYFNEDLYQPNGVVSSIDYELDYPTLSGVDYSPYDGKFAVEETIIEDGDEDYACLMVSYDGMGISQAKDEGLYLLVTYGTNNINTSQWYYVERQIEYMSESMGHEYDITLFDKGNYYLDYNGNVAHVYGVTNIAPASGLTVADSQYINYTGDFDGISDVSIVYGSTIEKKIAPYAQDITPSASRLLVGSTYDITIKYNENLKKQYSTEEVDLTMTTSNNISELGVYSNFVWSADEPNVVKFKFTPSREYAGDSCMYYFSLVNLVGVDTDLAPSSVGLFAVNNPIFACPKVPEMPSTVYASQPQLISDQDFNVSEWKYVDGTSVGKDLPNKLAIVASKPSQAVDTDMRDKIDDVVTPLSVSTFELSLNLCYNQVKWLDGKKVKVLVPFPAGYSAQDEGVSFKAYHYNDMSEIEEIECYVDKYGLVLFCNSFSPFAVVAVDGVDNTKSIMTLTEGNGQVEGFDFVKLVEKGKQKYTIKADKGYVIDNITLNGKAVEFSNQDKCEIELNYSDLKDKNSILKVNFASKKVVDNERENGYSVVGANYNANDSANWWIIVLIVVFVVAIIGVTTFIIRNYFKNKSQTNKK